MGGGGGLGWPPFFRPRGGGGQGGPPTRPAIHLYYRMPPLLSPLRPHLARTRLLGEPGVALVAVSGGADSVALLDLLHTLTPELGLSLVVAHVDHGIRSDSGTVARAVGELAERYERSEEHTSELQSQSNLVCRLLLEKKKKNKSRRVTEI